MKREGWRDVKLGEIADIVIGRTPSRKEKSYWDVAKVSENRWATIRDMTGKFVGETAEYISDLGVRKSGAKLIPEGTLLMSFKLSIGRVSITSNPMYTNEAIAAFFPKPCAFPEFLYYALPSLSLEETSDPAVKGMTLNKEKLRNLQLTLPPIPEQMRIASILSSIDAAIEHNQVVIDQLQVTKQGLTAVLLTGELSVRSHGGLP